MIVPGEFIQCRINVNDGRYHIRPLLSLVAGQQPDLILIDYLLIGINGGELCRQVKRDARTCHLPVIYYLRLCESHGFFGLLQLQCFYCQTF